LVGTNSITIQSGSALVAASESKLQAWRWPNRLATALWVAATLALAVALVIAPLSYGEGFSNAGIIAAAIAICFGAYLGMAAWRVASPELGLRGVIPALLILPVSFGLVAPALDQLWLSRDAAALVANSGQPRNMPIAVTGYAEPSLVFMLGTATLLVNPDRTAENLATARNGLALVEDREEPAFRAGLAARGWAPHAIGTVSGFDYSNGRNMVLTLYAGTPQ